MSEILERTESAIVVDCHLTLAPDDLVTRKLIFQGERSSGASLNCNGATIGQEDDEILDIIEIRSRAVGSGVWEPVHDVMITDCNIMGGVRVWGMARNANAAAMLESSRTLEHVSTVRNNAPYRITLDWLRIVSDTRVPLYLAPGVHHSTLSNSELYSGISALLYCDAESFGNLIDNNVMDAAGIYRDREIIALDGSSNNVLSRNQLFEARNGGIYLYRNCGEGGVIRHATPSNNEIVDNEILCPHNIWPLEPEVGVYLGSRDGRRGFCDDDAGYEYGSSTSDQDHARFNRVISNRMWGCQIKVGNITNHSNVVEDNVLR